MKKIWLVLGMLWVFVALPAAAQSRTAVPGVSNEVMLFGSWDDVREPSDIEQTTIHLRYGRYMTPNIVATAGISRTSFDGSGVRKRMLCHRSDRSLTYVLARPPCGALTLLN